MHRIALALAAAVVGAPAFAGVAVVTLPREIQIRSVDFDNQILEVFNFGPTDVDLSGWRFCSHDFNEQLRYSAPNGLNGVTIEAGTSLFVYFNNDAPMGDPDSINRSTVGTFATPLDQDAYGIQFFFPGPNGLQFGDSTDIADHVQWNINGQGVGLAERRTNQAVSEGLWDASGSFVATETDSDGIVLTDNSGDTSGSPSEYVVLKNNEVHNEAVDGDLSSDAANPSVITLTLGSTVVSGTVTDSGSVTGDRDFITVTVPTDQRLAAVNLVDWDTNNLGFIAVNSGATGFVPGAATNGNFLAGVLVNDANNGTDLLSLMETSAATTNSLSDEFLDAGTYTFVVQQLTAIQQGYCLEFVLEDVPSGICLGDGSGDGLIDGTDIGFLVNAFNTVLGDPNFNPAFDFNNDNAVIGIDIGGFSNVLNTACP